MTLGYTNRGGWLVLFGQTWFSMFPGISQYVVEEKQLWKFGVPSSACHFECPLGFADGCCDCCHLAGIAQFVNNFAEPGDPEYAPPVTKGETPTQRRARIHVLRLEEGAKKALEELEKCMCLPLAPCWIISLLFLWIPMQILEVCFKVHVGLSVEFGFGYPAVYAGFQAASNLGMHSCVVLTRDCS
jgi:hypothetical protein